MKSKITLVVRVLLGLVFFASGVAWLAGYAEPPPDLPENLKAFNSIMEATVYLMPLVKSLELICGLLLIAGFFVPLALVILGGITLHILLVHVFLAPIGLPIAIVLGLMLVYLGFFAEPYRGPIRALFRPR